MNIKKAPEGAGKRPDKVSNKNRYRKPEAVKRLEKIYNEWYFTVKDNGKHSSFPIDSRVTKRFRDDDANSLTQCIKSWFECNGGQMSRINTTGVFDTRLGRYRYSGASKGVADLVGVYGGKLVAIEIKFGHDRQSEDQKRYQVEVEAAGGTYYIARDLTSFMEWFEKTFGYVNTCVSDRPLRQTLQSLSYE
ncbi:MAG: hypothetical protein LBC84_06880 [Prevotellaceae bacterium]|jgi:hypothetical protein|nr:hypothetical protein [Prevotellaceae bacterium]